MRDRLTVAEHADKLLDACLPGEAGPVVAEVDALIDAVRCCGEFPECSHVLAFFEEQT